MPELLAALALGYLLGSLPSAALIARLKGLDIFRVGSGNMGAMNTARNVGPWAGAAVLLLDVGKGAAAVWLAGALAEAWGGSDALGLQLALLASVGAVAGHAWSAFAGLRGGKALAVALGVALPLYPSAGLLGLLLLVALQLLLRRTTLAAVITIALYPAVVLATLLRGGPADAAVVQVVASVAAISAIVVAKHLQALGRERAERA